MVAAQEKKSGIGAGSIGMAAAEISGEK